MKSRIVNLLSVKSIVTLMLTAVFSAMSLDGRISGDQFLVIFTTVTAFYFGTQHERTKEDKNGK